MDAWAGLTQLKPTTREVEAPFTLYIKQYPFKTCEKPDSFLYEWAAWGFRPTNRLESGKHRYALSNTSAMGSSVKFDETSPAALRLQATVFQKIKQIW
eukprot:gene28307-31418_t